MGKEVEIRTYRAIERCKEFRGTLTAFDKESVTIVDETGSPITFSRGDIALIKEAIDF